MTASQLINSTKLMSQSFEVETVHRSRPTQVLKTKKPEQILLQVRQQKMDEMNLYKEASSEKKYKDIQALLGMMNAHGKLPKKDQANPEAAASAPGN